MDSPQPSPGLRPARKAPEPSAALLALQDQGLELPSHRTMSFSVSPQSNPAYDPDSRVSPLSIISTPSNFRPSPLPPLVSQSSPSQHVWRRRTSSVDSVETTISGIINLYINLSKHSFRSEYEDVTADIDSDSGSIDNSPPMPMVHQPKAQAYRDTIAPLLERQFSSTSLDIPGLPTPFPSPMSLASMPMLMHPDASPSVPSLRLTPDGSRPATRAGPSPSGRSIQHTPEMPLPPNNNSTTPATADILGPYTHERRVNLEVPDVRDAESWYDEPLSPASPEDLEYRNALRGSQQSAVSPQTPNGKREHFRALAFESLSPPSVNLKTSPGLRSVNVVDMEGNMVPPPLDLSRSRSAMSGVATPANHDQYQANPSQERNGSITDTPYNGQHHDSGFTMPPGADTDQDLEAMKDSFSLSYERTSVQTDRRSGQPLRPEDIERPTSAFSDSSDSFIIYDTFSGQVKALWRDKFGKKKAKKSSTRKGDQDKEKKKSTGPGPTITKNVTTAFSDDPESYKYPYRVHRSTGTSRTSRDDTVIQPAYRMTTPDSIRISDPLQDYQGRPFTAPGPSQGTTRRSSEFFSHLPTFPLQGLSYTQTYLNSVRERDEPTNSDINTSSPQPITRHDPHSSIDRNPLAVRAIPLTKYQKYGVDAWNESAKKKRAKERERVEKERQKAATMAAARTRSQDRRQGKDSMVHQQMDKGNAVAQSTLRLSGPGPGPNGSKPGFYQQVHQTQTQTQAGYMHQHQHQVSNDSTGTTKTSSTHPGIESDDETMNFRTSKQASWRSAGHGSVGGSGGTYNNDLFEASGGGKKKSGHGSGLASRLLMSSEEKRKKKVKESITIVGGKRMGDSHGDGLVKI